MSIFTFLVMRFAVICRSSLAQLISSSARGTQPAPASLPPAQISCIYSSEGKERRARGTCLSLTAIPRGNRILRSGNKRKHNGRRPETCVRERERERESERCSALNTRQHGQHPSRPLSPSVTNALYSDADEGKSDSDFGLQPDAT